MGMRGNVWTRAGIVGMAAVASLALLAACGSPDPTPAPTPAPAEPAEPAEPTEPTRPTGFEAEWEELIQAAREEGRLVVATGVGYQNYRPLFDHFGELFDIEVTLSGGPAGEVASRALAEQAAGRFELDLAPMGPNSMTQRLMPNNALDPIKPLLFHPEVTDTSLWYGGQHWYVDLEQEYVFAFAGQVEPPTGFWFNTNQVSQEEIDGISSAWDLLDPRWEGRIIGQPAVQFSATTPLFLAYVHPEIGPEFIERLYREMNVRWVTEPPLLDDGLGTGQYHIAMFTGGADFTQMKAEGLPVESLTDLIAEGKPWNDTLVLQSNTAAHVMGVARNAPHPSAAKLFVNWFLSVEGQTANHLYRVPPTEPPPTLRNDVTEWGMTNPSTRRDLSVTDYLFPDATPEMSAQRQEAIDFSVALYEEVTGVAR